MTLTCQGGAKSCTLCCKIIGVHELRKPRYQWCQHTCAAGCGIYKSRPADCETWECYWLASQHNGQSPLPEKLKPSICGAVMHEANTGNALIIDINDGVDWRAGTLGWFVKNLSIGLTILIRYRAHLTVIRDNRIVGEDYNEDNMDPNKRTVDFHIDEIPLELQKVAVP